MKICFLLLPFSYNGPCATESGPRALMHHISKRIIAPFDVEVVSQGFEISPKEYLKIAYLKLVEIYAKYDKIVILGGNHLSCLPAHLFASDYLADTYTFDAHRDYLYNEGLITHASFFRYVPNTLGKANYLLGYRDTILEEDTFDYFDHEINNMSYDEFVAGHTQTLSDIYLDLDIDVFDPLLIPCTGSKKDDGITFDQFKDFLCKVKPGQIKLLSISEYIPLLETNTNVYANSIIDAIYPILSD